MTRARILLTGFGPFPGVPQNASADLVMHLAERPVAGAEVTALVLPTEWHRGVAELEAALARFTPDIALHFGVSGRASGFVIEERALNVCEAREDACGALPVAALISHEGPRERPSTFPAAQIAGALEAARLPVSRSDNAGGYLCNAILYASLASRGGAPVTGFIHLPAVIGRGGALTTDQALYGGHLIIETCLAARRFLAET